MRDLHFATPRSGFTFDISGDLDLAQKLSADVKDVQKAQKRAVSTMLRRLRVEARREIQTEYRLKAQTINERLSVRRAYDGVGIVGSSRGINLINFGARQTRAGVTYAVKKADGRKMLAHAFIRKTRAGDGPYVWMRGEAAGERYAKGYSGKVLSHFIRGGALHPGYDKHGYPIFPQFGPSVAQMLKHGDRPERLVAYSEKIIESELDRLLGPK